MCFHVKYIFILILSMQVVSSVCQFFTLIVKSSYQSCAKCLSISSALCVCVCVCVFVCSCMSFFDHFLFVIVFICGCLPSLCEVHVLSLPLYKD